MIVGNKITLSKSALVDIPVQQATKGIRPNRLGAKWKRAKGLGHRDVSYVTRTKQLYARKRSGLLTLEHRVEKKLKEDIHMEDAENENITAALDNTVVDSEFLFASKNVVFMTMSWMWYQGLMFLYWRRLACPNPATNHEPHSLELPRFRDPSGSS